MKADALGRILEAARTYDPKFAVDLADFFAPGKTPDWVIGFGKAMPDVVVAKKALMVRPLIENSAKPDSIMKAAGYDAIDAGRDVRKLTGAGIRLSTAKFNPRRGSSHDITAGLAGLVGPGAVVEAMNPGEGM